MSINHPAIYILTKKRFKILNSEQKMANKSLFTLLILATVINMNRSQPLPKFWWEQAKVSNQVPLKCNFNS